jgi:GNAT superfamily N-acetyltransferase
VIEIQALEPGDWRVVREVRLRSLEDAPSAFTSSYERGSAFDEVTWRDRASTCQWFVAMDAARPIGIAGGIRGWSGDPAERELIGMWVAPSHRRQGMARRLLDRVAEWARSEGASTLSLSVRQGNDGARVAYLTMGMRSTGEVRSVWNDPTETVNVMELDLGTP